MSDHTERRPTPETVARWMLSQVDAEGHLYQSDAVAGISQLFGDTFTYENENGHSAISRAVLKAFREVSDDDIVWVRGERAWRKREAYDDPGRQQY